MYNVALVSLLVCLVTFISGCAGIAPSPEAESKAVHTAVYSGMFAGEPLVCSQLYIRDGLLVVANTSSGGPGADLYLYDPISGLLVRTRSSYGTPSVSDGRCGIPLPFNRADRSVRIMLNILVVTDPEIKSLLTKIATDHTSVERGVIRKFLVDKNYSPFCGFMPAAGWEQINTLTPQGQALIERVKKNISLRESKGNPSSFEFIGHFSFNIYDKLFDQMVSMNKGGNKQ